MHRCLGPCVAGAHHPGGVRDGGGAGAALPRRPQRRSWCKRLRARDGGSRPRRSSSSAPPRCATRWSRSRRSASGASSPRSTGEDVDVYGVHVGRRQRRGRRPGDARRPGARPPRALLGRRGRVAPARLLSELLPQIYDRTTFIPKEIHLPVPIEGEEALLDWLSRAQGRARLPAAAGARRRRPSASRWRCTTPSWRYRRRFRGGRELDPAAAALAPPPRPRRAAARASKASTSRTSRAARRSSPRWWSGRKGRMRKEEYRSFNIRGLAGPGRLRVDAPGGRARATGGGSKRWARCPT